MAKLAALVTELPVCVFGHFRIMCLSRLYKHKLQLITGKNYLKITLFVFLLFFRLISGTMKFSVSAFLFIIAFSIQAQSGLVGYYSFCNCNANDNSGNNLHGTIKGSPECTSGQRGEGFLFNQTPGSNGCGQNGGEYVQLPTLEPIWENGFTVCAWVRFDNLAYYERIIDFGNNSGDSGGMPVWFGREGSSNNLTLESWISSNGSTNRSTGRLVAPNAITNGSIEYYCATISGDSMKIYVNGVLKAQKKGHPIKNVSRTKNFIGRSNWCSNDPDFKGFMDEVRIYNRALSEAEINSLYLQTPTFGEYQHQIYAGMSVPLSATGGINYQWWPGESLSDSTIANPVASPLHTTTYKCRITMPDGCIYEDSLTIEVLRVGCQSECTGQLGDNIFPNGDFGSGTPNVLPVNPGIAPGYIYTTNPPPNDGRYTVTNNTAPWGSFAGNWINIQDNGPEPNGYMMVVNASVSPGLFYEKSVNVCENTLYEFSIDVINMLESFVSGIRPNVSFLIDGIALCETGDIPNDETWRTIRFSFYTAPGQTTVKLALRNNAPGGNGNDLALDNISFRACGPDITIPGPTFDFCEGVPVTLQTVISNSPYTNGSVYQWQVNSPGGWTDIPGANNPEYTETVPVDNAQYRLLVSSSSLNISLENCRVESQVITLKKLPALQPQLQSANVNCFGANNGSVTLAGVTGVPPFSILWSNSDTTSQLTNLAPGFYTATLTDSKGCTGISTAEITEPPVLNSLTSVVNVSCFGLSNGSTESVPSGGTPPYTYLWSTGTDTSAVNNLTAGAYELTLTDANGCSLAQSLTVNQPDLLVVQPDSVNASCFGFSNGTVETTASGGTPPYSYLWSTGSDTSLVNGLAAGTYDVTITDTNGCSLSQSVTVNQPDQLTIQYGTTPVSCFGLSNGTAQITAAGGIPPYTYIWNNGEITPDIKNLAAGMYVVTLTDANGCQLTQSATVNQPALLAAQIAAIPVTCFGLSNGTAQTIAAGGIPPYLYNWSNSGTVPSIQNLSAGNYSVTVTDANGCSQVKSVTVNQPDLLIAATSTTDATCFGFTNGTAQISVGGGTGPYNYQWSNGNNSPASQSLQAGSYSITATDANNCSLTRSFLISQPTQLLISGTASAASCFGYSNGSVQTAGTGGVQPYSYSWNNGGNTTVLQNISAGTYSVTITDNQNCTSSESYTVTQPPQLLLQQSGALHISCYGLSNGAVSATATGGTPPYNMLWNTGQQTMEVSNLPAGLYTATVTDANSCTTTISINLEQPPLLVLSLTAADPVCTNSDGSVVASATGGVPPYGYLWATGQLTTEISRLEAGLYAVTVTDDKNCTVSGETYLQDAVLPVVSLGDDITLNLGEEIRAVALSNMPGSRIESYAWDGDAGVQDCSDCRYLEFIPLEDGCQTVIITTTDGCVATDEVCYRVNTPRRIYFPNVFSPNDDGENDFFHPFSDASVKTIRFMTIYDRWGNKLYHNENFSPNDPVAGWDGQSAGRDMNNAVFIWVAETEFIDGQIRLYKGDVTLIR